MAFEINNNRGSKSTSPQGTDRAGKSDKSDKSDKGSRSERAADESRKAANEAKQAANEAKQAAAEALKSRTAAEARRHAEQAESARGRAQAAQGRAQASVDTLKKELASAPRTERPAVEGALRQAEKALGETRTATTQATAASTQARDTERSMGLGQSSFTTATARPATYQTLSGPTPTAGPTPTSTPTVGPMPTSTPTVGPTPTAGPPAAATASPTPSPVPGPTPTAAPATPSGPPQPIGSVAQDGQIAEDRLDGALVGAGGAAYPAGTDAYATRPVGPNNGKPATETVYYVNGIQNDANFQYGSMQNVANSLGANVYGIHNSTAENFPIHSMLGDLIQCLTDKARLPNSATSALASQVVKDLEAGRPVHLMAHSQGALVTSNALTLVKDYLLKGRAPPLSPDAADKLLRGIKVETFGGAAAHYPYGPQYVHYVNTNDTVPMTTGLGSHWDAYSRQMNAGGDRATFHFIHDDPRSANPAMQNNYAQLAEGIPAHDFNDGYLAHRQPFAEAHANNTDLRGPSPVNQPGQAGQPAYYPATPPSAPEQARRRAGQAESDSALARAQAEAAVREAREALAAGNPTLAAQALERAQWAADRASAAAQRASTASREAVAATLADPQAGLDYTPGGPPPAAGGALYHSERATENKTEAQRQVDELRRQLTRSARVA